MKKKLLTLALCSAMCIGFISASGSKETTSPDKMTVESKDKYAVTSPIEITWWHALENQYSPLVTEIVDNFNNSQDMITVKAEYIGNYATVNESLVAAQAAGTGLPALVVANTPYVAQYGASGLCENLSPYIKATDFDINDFGEGLIKASSYEDQQVSLPFLISTQIMYYNKQMAKDKDISIPAKFSDMDEFLSKAAEFNADGTVKTWGTIIPGWDNWYFETLFLNNGVNIVNPDGITTDLGSDASMKVTKEIRNWIDKDYAYFAVGQDASSSMRQTFYDGKAFSVIHTSSLYNTYVDNCKGFDVGMSWLPAGMTKNQEIGGCVLLIPSKNDQQTKNAAWQFLSYLCSPDVNMQWAIGTGYIPTRKSVLETKKAEDFLAMKPEFKAIFDNLDYINPRIQNPQWNQLASIWRNYLSEFYVEKTSISDNIADMVEEMDEVLGDN